MEVSFIIGIAVLIFLLILFHGGLLSFHTHITKIIIAERTLPLRFVKVNSRNN